MRFVRHPTWGLGVVTAEDQSNLSILFESAGRKRLAKSFKGLVEVPDGEVPADHRLRTPERWPEVERDARRAVAKGELPNRFDGFIKEFIGLFPTGLRSQECDSIERTYKVEAGEYARKELRPDLLDSLLEQGNHKDIVARARRCLARTNLAFPNELMKFGDVPESAHGVVAERLVRLVKAGSNTPAALEELAACLVPHGAAKWTIVSLLPFLLDPTQWPFVKPTAIQRAEAATGIDVEYNSRPSARTYGLIRDLYEQVARELRGRGPEWEPRDFIDVQTFLWVASGMKRELDEDRKRTEDE
jgi:hypothetical protein